MNTTTQTPSLVSAIGFLVNHRLPELDTNKTWMYSVQYGNKYAKIISETNRGPAGGVKSVWGFVALKDMTVSGIPNKRGDLLKAASFKAPAKHARGNLLEGTAEYDLYGPAYLNNPRSSW